MFSLDEDVLQILYFGDDGTLVREAVQRVTSGGQAWNVFTANSIETTFDRLENTDIDCLVYEPPDQSGTELLQSVREDYPALPCVFVTTDPTQITDALSRGATDFHLRQEGVDPTEVLAHRLDSVLTQGLTSPNRHHETTIEFLDTLYTVTTDSELSHDEKIAQLLELGSGYLDLQIGYLTEIEVTDESGPLGTQTIVDVYGTHEGLQPGESRPLSDAYCRKTIQTEGLFAIENAVESGWEDGSAPDRSDLGCYIGGTVTVDGELSGTLCFAAPQPDATGFSERDRTAVRLLSKWVGYELERQQATKDVELAETVFQRGQDAIFVIDVIEGSEFRIERVNRAYAGITGLDPVDILGRSPRDVVGDELGSEVEQRYRECVERQEPMEYTEYLPIDRENQQWQTELTPVIEDGRVVKLVGTTRNITEQQERIETLRQLEENVSDVIWMSDPEKASMEFISESYEEVWGRSRESLHEDPLSFVEAIHPEDRDRARAALATQKEDPAAYDETYRVVRKNGGIRWVHDRASGIYEDGQLTRIVGVASDITARIESERELEMKNRAMDEAPIGITITDPSQADNPIIYANDAFTEITGYSRDEIIGRNCRFLQGEDTDGARVDEIREAIDAGTPVSVELRNYQQDGTQFWNEVTVAPLWDDDGEITNYVGFQRDITLRKERERDLALRNRAMAEAPIGITIHDATEEGTPVIYANGSMEDITGYDRNTVVGARLPLFSGADTDAERIEALENAFETGESVSEVLLLYREKGTPFWGRISLAPVTEDDEVTHFVGFLQDITESKEHTEEIERRLDEFSDVLAKELQTPLQSAKASLESVDTNSSDDALTETGRSLEHLEEVLDDLATVHSFSVKSRTVFETTAESDDN